LGVDLGALGFWTFLGFVAGLGGIFFAILMLGNFD
jgi:hypothetical protein